MICQTRDNRNQRVQRAVLLITYNNNNNNTRSKRYYNISDKTRINAAAAGRVRNTENAAWLTEYVKIDLSYTYVRLMPRAHYSVKHIVFNCTNKSHEFG